MINEHLCFNKITKLSQCLVIFSCCTSKIYAQSVPSDLIDLSMDDLFKTEIGSSMSSSNQQKMHDDNKWNLAYNYRRLKFQGYRDGTTDLSNSEVLFDGNPANRTNNNFPVLPDKIIQEIHAFISTYSLSNDKSLNIVIPYVKQSTDHFSVVPNYPEFNITTQGLGDISITSSFKLANSNSDNWATNIGLSIPTGSIDEEGDTPRAPGNQQLPYSMQLGSGTYDIPASLNYTNIGMSGNWGAQILVKLRLGKNDRDYRLGNRFSMSSWFSMTRIHWFVPTIKLAYKYWGKIEGADTEIQVPGPFPFPAAVTNPDLFGGQQVDVFFGAKLPLNTKGQYINFEVNKPVYQNLNGPQSKEVLGLSASINLSF